MCDRVALGKIHSGSIKMFFALRAAKHAIALGESELYYPPWGGGASKCCDSESEA